MESQFKQGKLSEINAKLLLLLFAFILPKSFSLLSSYIRCNKDLKKNNKQK